MTPFAAAKPSIFLFSRSSNQPTLIEALHKGLSQAADIEYRLTSRTDDLAALIPASARVVLFANCLMKEDIADLYNILPQFAERVADGTVKVLVLNSIGHPRLGSLLRARAAVDVLEMPATLKSIQYKLKSGVNSVHHAYQRAASARAHEGSEIDPILGTKTRVARAKPKAAGHDVLWQSPVEFNYDYWWIPNRQCIRYVVGVWLIDLMGPGPVAGTWEEIPGLEREGEKAWSWRPRVVAEDIFQTPDGRWIFFGKQPEFSWQKNLWSFISKMPLFAFYPDGGVAPDYVRIEYRPDEGLLFMENSNFTGALLARIQSTFESRLGGRAFSEAPPEKESGNFDGWDFKITTHGSVTQEESSSGHDGGVKWNDHTGAVGASFHRDPVPVPIEPEMPGSGQARDVLTPDQELGPKLGLAAVSSGVSSGVDAFEKIELQVSLLRKNGATVEKSPEIMLYEVNESGAILLIRELGNRLGERLLLRFSLDSGDFKMECSMDWELTSIDLSLDDAMLATGVFRSGDFEPLFVLLDRLDARKKELKNFYSAARG